MNIPFNKPFVPALSETYILAALKSNKHCGNHPFGMKCIDLMKKKYGFGQVFLTTSCTSAMEMGAMLAGIGPGDEVILPSYTFSSTANAIVLRGAKPVFCEISPDTMNIDVDKIEPLITGNTKMIAPIDYAGIPCDIDTIMQISQNNNLIVMQDAAQSYNSYHNNGKPCGSIPQLAAFSFHETKNLNCGEGGALIVNDDSLVERANFLQEKGTDRSLVLKGVKSKYSWVDIGSSFLLSDILAAMLLSQIESVDTIQTMRGNITRAYNSVFREYALKGFVSIPIIPNGVMINHHAYFVIFASEDKQKSFLSRLKEKNIFAYIGYLPLHSSPMGRKFGYKPDDLPITEDIASRIVRLPFYFDLQEEELDYCVDGMRDVLKGIYR